MLMVCACASARGLHTPSAPTASASATARIIRTDFIVPPPRKKWGAGYHAPVRRARTIHSRLCRPRGERSGGPARSIQNDGASSRRTSAGDTTNGGPGVSARSGKRSEEHTSELQSRQYLVCRLLLEKKKISHFKISE